MRNSGPDRSRNEGGRCRKCLLLITCVPMHICDMLLGYARVSTYDQDLTLQKAALKTAGCRRTFEEKVSGAKRARPELERMLEQLRDDDVVVVTRLDRLARSTRDLLDIAERLNGSGVEISSLARGVPVGGELDWLDDGTIIQALRQRRPA